MKKGVLILLGMFMMVSTVEAKNGENLPNRFRVNYYSYDNAVNFVERGIEFFIFSNGEFDFDTHTNNYYNRRNSGVRINRDYRGRIRSVGNVYINYDRRGNVTRIGSIFIRYYRGQLSRVGNLRVHYDRWGYPIFYGNVRNYYYNNGIRINFNFGDVCDYNDAYFYRNDFRRNYTQFREDRNFYYYKANPNAKIGKRSTIIKRRKPATKVDRKKIIKRRSTNTYRKPSSNINSRRNSNTNSRNTDVKRKTSRKLDKISKPKKRVNRSYKKSDIKKQKIEKGKKVTRRRS